MTRINCIPVNELTDKHLIAEYREMPRISSLARPLDDPPSQYVLGTGHCKFFYDKGGYLKRRFARIVREMKRRGFSPRFTEYRSHPKGLNKHWEPTARAQRLNRQRIKQRLNTSSEKRSQKR